MDINFLYNEYKASSGISTDTRTIKTNHIFFALRGPNFNANTLAEEALNKGARLAVIDDEAFSSIKNTFLVEDCLKALQELAIFYRNKLDIPFFGLTGSNGKTTTKELIKAVLEKKFKVLATRGNLNNHIGVPLTVLSITKEHNIAIIEMGANHVGEIAALCKISKPTHGLITNIGKAHIGEFGGFDNIIRGKSELFDYILRNNGVAFINAQDKVLKNMSKRFKDPVIYPSGEGGCNIQFISADPFIKGKTSNGKEFETQLIGEYNFPNVAAAICVGNYFEVEPDLAIDAIERFTSSNNRSQMTELGSNTVILDAYNANPSSMEAAVKNFGQMNSEKKKIIILGDMLELGEDTPTEHRNLGVLVKNQHFNEVYFVGVLMNDAADAYPEATYFQNKDELVAYFQQHPPKDSFIMLKGSRSMGLESLVEAFKVH